MVEIVIQLPDGQQLAFPRLGDETEGLTIEELLAGMGVSPIEMRPSLVITKEDTAPLRISVVQVSGVGPIVNVRGK